MTEIGEILEATQEALAAARVVARKARGHEEHVCIVPAPQMATLNRALLKLDLALGSKLPFEPESDDGEFPITWGGPATTPMKRGPND